MFRLLNGIFLVVVFISVISLVIAIAQTAEEYYDKGITKHELGDHKGAIQDYNKAIELNPNDADGYLNRGLAKMNLGQKDSGCLDLSKAGEMGLSQVYDLIKKYCQ